MEKTSRLARHIINLGSLVKVSLLYKLTLTVAMEEEEEKKEVCDMVSVQ